MEKEIRAEPQPNFQDEKDVTERGKAAEPMEKREAKIRSIFRAAPVGIGLVSYPDRVLLEVNACRKAFPTHYIKVNALDATQGWESTRLSFIVNRPPSEPGFRVVRQEIAGRSIRYTIESYAVDRPEGSRY